MSADDNPEDELNAILAAAYAPAPQESQAAGAGSNVVVFTKDKRKSRRKAQHDDGPGVGSAGELPPGGEIDEWDAVPKTNLEFALVIVGSRAVILRLRPKAPIEDRIKILSVEAFKHLLANRKIKIVREMTDELSGESVERVSYRDLAPYWLKSKQRLTYDGLEFYPDPNNAEGTPGYFNLWRGFSVAADLQTPPERRAAKYKTFRDHLLVNVCDGNEDHFKWVFAWMAHMIQFPRQRTATALVMRGGFGVGKTVVGEQLGALFPTNYFLVDDPRYVTGQFNQHMASCLLLQVDEGFWAGDKAAEGRLKGLISAKYQMIEAKGIDPIRVPNRVRLMFSSNEDWVVPAGMGERRFCIFDVAEHSKENRDYFAEIEHEMEHGGREAFLADLLTLDIAATANVFVIPKTKALLEQKIRSFEGVTAWLFQRLYEGTITHRSSKWPEFVPTRTIYNDYLRQSERQGIRRRANETEFGMRMFKMIPALKRARLWHDVEDYNEEGRLVTARKQTWGYMLPPLDECREHFTTRCGQPIDWSEGVATIDETEPAEGEI